YPTDGQAALYNVVFRLRTTRFISHNTYRQFWIGCVDVSGNYSPPVGSSVIFYCSGYDTYMRNIAENRNFLLSRWTVKCDSEYKHNSLRNAKVKCTKMST
ncbi:hypothetical protein L9F63_009390, partial [Diploptera punctata]